MIRDRSSGPAIIPILVILVGIAALYFGWSYLLDAFFPAEHTPGAHETNAYELSSGISRDDENKSPASRAVDAAALSAVNNPGSSGYGKETDRKLSKPGDYGSPSNSKTQSTGKGSLHPDNNVDAAGKKEKTGAVADKPSSIDPYSPKAATDNSNENPYDDALDDEDTQDLPTGHYSISGQVLDEQGYPVSGIEIIAKVRHLFESDTQMDANPDAQSLAITGVQGEFAFIDLANGEYSLSIIATDTYTSTGKTVRAGQEAVKLHVVGTFPISVYGQVTDWEGKPLSNIEIAATGLHEPVISDGYGNYQFELTVRNDRGYSINYSADGYREQKLALNSRDWSAQKQVERNVMMEPIDVLASVTGTVRSKNGESIEGERVYLQSATQKYRATTDEKGFFKLEEVETEVAYALWLMPKGPYQKYRKNYLMVPQNGVSGVDITLDPLGVGSLSGTMMDMNGNAIADFDLFVRSDSSTQRLQVTSDSRGEFEIENVPQGRIRFETGSLPRFIVGGIHLAEGEHRDVDLIFDKGNYSLAGQVEDDTGRSLGGAAITVSGIVREDGLLYESMRKTVTDEQGRFQVTGMGEGIHTVIASLTGFEGSRQEHNVGDGMGSTSAEVKIILKALDE